MEIPWLSKPVNWCSQPTTAGARTSDDWVDKPAVEQGKLASGTHCTSPDLEALHRDKWSTQLIACYLLSSSQLRNNIHISSNITHARRPVLFIPCIPLSIMASAANQPSICNDEPIRLLHPSQTSTIRPSPVNPAPTVRANRLRKTGPPKSDSGGREPCAITQVEERARVGAIRVQRRHAYCSVWK
jgi:hypothetical protein